jgi:hypothetical protein
MAKQRVGWEFVPLDEVVADKAIEDASLGGKDKPQCQLSCHYFSQLLLCSLLGQCRTVHASGRFFQFKAANTTRHRRSGHPGDVKKW